MKQSTTNVFIIISIVVLILVLLCCLSIAGFFILASRGSIGMPMMKTTKTSELLTNSTPVPTLVANIPTPQISVENDEAANRTKLTLNEMIIPESDPIDLAERLSGKQNVPKTLIDTHAPYHIGDGKAFWVMNTDTTKVSSIETTLRYKGNHIYIWIDNRVNYNKNALTTLGDIIDQEIVPTNREFFGTEWNPGVDGDERFHILYAKGIGRWVAGYFSSADEVHPDAHPYSNAHEMFLLSADNVQLNDSYILGTIAHEYQHMIHWYLDKNEESWVNEGFSMLAEQVNGTIPAVLTGLTCRIQICNSMIGTLVTQITARIMAPVTFSCLITSIVLAKKRPAPWWLIKKMALPRLMRSQKSSGSLTQTIINLTRVLKFLPIGL